MQSADFRATDNSPFRSNLFILTALATVFALIHIATNGRYGFHRDEWQFLSEARHLDWGFVPFPPLDPFLERIGLSLFGLSLVGLRMFSVIAQSIALVVSGLMAKELGGNRWAQVVTLICVGLSPLPIFNATEFQYTSFDFLWWVLAAYFIVRLLKTENQRWWIAIGITLGLGMQTKYSIAFFIAGILTGLILSSARRSLKSGWFYAGAAVGFLIFLPNLLWLIHHDFISYTFLQSIHQRDLRLGRGADFLRNQLYMNVNAAAAPLAIVGLVAFFRSTRYRMFGWMFAVTFALFCLGKGRFYYVAPLYPMAVAMGSVVCERWLAHIKAWQRRTVQTALYVGVALFGAYAAAILVPFASSGPMRDFALKRNGDLREEFGWHELVRTVAGIRDTLTPEQQAHLGITVGNYGEAGSLELLGPAYHLPAPISTTNTAWLRGYPTSPPTTLIVVGLSEKEADSIFTGCRWAGHNGNPEGIHNEESDYHPDIFLCGPPRDPWSVLWKKHRDFG
ncbi:MAG: glycosyltransferase family 39 protein [Acidobacteriota bacterium]|nr:glycosyltransferase family 39 protein [Acidobacteriota bacterium]